MQTTGSSVRLSVFASIHISGTKMFARVWTFKDVTGKCISVVMATTVWPTETLSP